MSARYPYTPSALQKAAKELGFLEADSPEATMAYRIPIRGRTHMNIVVYIGSGAWFSDSFDLTNLNDTAYWYFVDKLKTRARAQFKDEFATPVEVQAFLNEHAPQVGPPGVLPKPLDCLAKFLQDDLDYCWKGYTESVDAELAKMDADLKDLTAQFAARKRKWEEEIRGPEPKKKARKE